MTSAEILLPVHFAAGFIFLWPPGLMNSSAVFSSFQSELIFTLSAPDRLWLQNMNLEGKLEEIQKKEEEWEMGPKKTHLGQRGLTFRKQVMTWKTLISCPEYLNQLSWDALWRKGSECPMGLGRLESLWECAGPGVSAYLCWVRPTERQAYLEHFGSLSISTRKQQTEGRKHLEWVLSHSKEKWQQRRK